MDLPLGEQHPLRPCRNWCANTRSLLTAWLLLAATAAWASNHIRPYSDVPLTGADFTMTAPDPLPVEDGIETAAEIKTNVVYTYEYGPCTGPAGAVVCVATRVTYTANMDREESWISDPTDKNTLDHEQGHLDEAQAAAKKANAEANKAILDGTLKGKGATEAEANADLAKKVAEIGMRNKKAVEDKNMDGKNDYDHDTGHGTDSEKQKAARMQQKAALVEPSTKTENKTSAEAQSRTEKSISFDAASGRLTIDRDFIVSVLGGGPVPDPLDPALGAEVVLPTFTSLGQTVDGGFFFIADGADPLLQIIGDNGVLFSADLPYLQYDPLLNLFYGLTGGFDAAEGVSQFIDTTLADILVGAPALFGIEFRPDLDFMALTADFTNDGRSAASNSAGLRLLNTVPEPPGLLLVGCALVLLVLTARRRRQASDAAINLPQET